MVQMVNKLTLKFPLVTRLIWTFILHCLQFNILFVAKHMPGIHNNIADALSGFWEDWFQELAVGGRKELEPMLGLL